MADKFNAQFTPDTIDEQIDTAIQKDESDTDPTHRTIQALQQHYAPAQDYSQSLERVWSRFTEQRAPLETVEHNVYSQLPVIAGARPGQRSRRVPVVFPATPLGRSGMVAALVFLVLIVGGMIVLPQLFHRSNLAALQTQRTMPTPTPVIIGEQPSYDVLPADGGKAYLYTGISVIRAGESPRTSPVRRFKPHSGKLVEVDSQRGGTKIWSYTGDLGSTPLLAEGVLYVPGQSGLDALRASDHKLLWHQNLLLLTPFDVSNGMLYAFGQDAGLEALRVSDGALLWHSNYTFAVWIDKDIVCATQNFDYINMLRASDGRLLWRTRLVDESVDVENGIVLLHTPSYGIRALNGKTGALLWSNEHINNSILGSQNGIVYVNESNGKNTITALRANNGQVLWQYQPSGINGMLASNAALYISTGENVLALDLNTGKLLWQVKVMGQLKQLTDGALYLDRTGQGDLAAFVVLKTSDGSLLWQSKDVDNLYSSSVQVQDGVIYRILADGKTIVALKASDGTLLARYQTPIA